MEPEARAPAANRVRCGSRMALLPGMPDDFVEMLRVRSGLKPLPVVDASGAPAAAADIFHREGVVAVRGALDCELLQRLKGACAMVMADVVQHDPQGIGGRGQKRYSFGGSSSTRAQLHHAEWAALIDVSAVTRVLDAIWDSTEYADVLAPAIAVNFLVEDQTPFNGPLRHVTGSHHRHMREAPGLQEEPEEWLLSTMCPFPAGTALIRDLRAWHGGTPNLSMSHRAMPNAEFAAPSFTELSHFARASLPYELWEGLSERGKRLARNLKAEKGEKVEAHVEFDLGLSESDFFGGMALAPLFEPCKAALRASAA